MEIPEQQLPDNVRTRKERLVTLTVFGLLAFNYPLLQVFDVPINWLGIPVLYIYLFGIWGLFILLTAKVLGSKSHNPKASQADSQE